MQILLADVVVSHSLTPYNVARCDTMTVVWQTIKNKKYANVASRLGAEMLNLSLDTCGGMASDAIKLAKAIGEEGERWSAGTWSSGFIERTLLGSRAVPVQRGNAMTMLNGSNEYGRCAEAQRRESAAVGRWDNVRGGGVR
jgi:hypothetical protein